MSRKVGWNAWPAASIFLDPLTFFLGESHQPSGASTAFMER